MRRGMFTNRTGDGLIKCSNLIGIGKPAKWEVCRNEIFLQSG